jgi:hypothetical protein
MKKSLSRIAGRRILLFLDLLLVLAISACIEVDWMLHLKPDGSGTAELKFINESLPTTNFKGDLEAGNDMSTKLYRMGAKSETGKEQGRDYVLYRVAFSNVSEMSDDDLMFAFAQREGGCEFSVTPTEKARRQAWQAPPITFRLAVAMPGRIIEAGSGQINGDLVTFDTRLSEVLAGRAMLQARSEMPILTFSSKNIGVPQVAAILGVALLLVVGAFGFRKLFGTRKGVVVASNPSPGASRFCLYCGGAVSPGASFCGHCGSQLS